MSQRTFPRDAPRTILFLHPSADLYGADRTLIDLIESLDRSRRRAVVVVPKNGPLVARLTHAGAKVEIAPLGIGSQSSLSLSGLFRLAHELPRSIVSTLLLARRLRPAVIHTNTMVPLGAAIGARLSGRPHVWHVHEIPTREWVTRIFAGMFRHLSDRVVFNSQSTARHFLRHSRGLEAKSVVVLNGTNREPDALWVGEGPQFREELGVGPGQPLVLMIGRINAWKGQELLLEAAQILRQRYGSARYLVVGSPPDGQEHFEDSLMRSIEARDLGDIVTVRPFEENVARIYDACDVVVVPSTRPEPFGLVAIEAMAFGKPVIAANHGGLSEIVVDGETGLLFEPGDADGFARAIAQLVDDPAAAMEMGRAARARQESTFSIGSYCSEFHRLYDGMSPATEDALLPDGTKIVHVALGKANPARMNGVNVVLHNLAEAQVKLGLSVEVWGLTNTPHAPTPPRAYPLRLFRRARTRFFLSRRLAAAIRSEPSPCLFHLHGGFLPEFHAIVRILKRCGHVFTISPHGAYQSEAMRKSPLRKHLYMQFIERPMLRSARRVQAFSPGDAADVERQAPPGTVVVLPNGQVAISEAAARTATKSAARPVFGYCGRFAMHTKGLDRLVDGFAQYVHEHGTGSLELIGDGSDRNALRDRVRSNDIDDRVTFVGPKFGVEKLERLHGFDFFALTSRHEGMPMSALEAASLGLVLIITRQTNIATEVEEYRCGYVLDDNSVERIADAMHRAQACLEAGEYEAMGTAARRMAADRFSWEEVAERTARELYGLEAPRRAG